MINKIAILGLGWLGLPLAKHLRKEGYEVVGSTTSSQKLMDLLQSRISVRLVEVNKHAITGNWRGFIENVSVLVINIPPGREKAAVKQYPLKIAQILASCPDDLKIIFVSSTSVYGDLDHKVTEKTLTDPTTASGKAVREAEKILVESFPKNATIVRLSGLFGKDRHPGRFYKDAETIKNPNGPVNMIHRDDAIQLITAIIQQDRFGEIFNGCSDEHPTRSDFYSEAMFDLGLDVPDYDETEPATGKKVSNEKSKSELGISYYYANPLDYFKQ